MMHDNWKDMTTREKVEVFGDIILACIVLIFAVVAAIITLVKVL